MVSRASAVGCHPLRDVPSLRRRGRFAAAWAVVNRAANPSQSLQQHYPGSAIRACEYMYVRTARSGERTFAHAS